MSMIFSILNTCFFIALLLKVIYYKDTKGATRSVTVSPEKCVFKITAKFARLGGYFNVCYSFQWNSQDRKMLHIMQERQLNLPL